MTGDGLLVVKCLFGNIWRLFTSWYIPGTTTTPAAFLLFVAVCGLALKFMYRIINIAPDPGLSFDDSPVAVPGRGVGTFFIRKR